MIPITEARSDAAAPTTRTWQSRTLDLGSPVHYADFGGSGPVIVLVHGIASSHLNWMGIGEELARDHRVLAVDLPGYGLSRRASEPATVETSQVYLDRFIDAVSLNTPVVLFGHSMGGLVAMLEATRHPEKLSRLMLLAPAAPYPRRPRLGLLVAPFLVAALMPEKTAALMRRRGKTMDPDRVVREIMARVVAPGDEVPEEILQAHVNLLRRQRADHDWNEQALVESAASLFRTTVRRKRFRAMVEEIAVPTLLMHGTRDRVVPFGAGEWLAGVRPDWTWRPLPDLGHMAQMVAPEVVLGAVKAWLDGCAQAEK